MNDGAKTLEDFIELFWRRKWQLVLAGAGVFALSLVVAFALPAVYRSTATVLIEEPEVPRELIQSTVTSYADQRLQVITQRVMTTQNLIDIIEKYDLYVEDRALRPLNLLVVGFRETINMEIVNAEVVDPRSGRPTEATIAFTLSFEHGEPRVAQQIVNELVSLYLSENLRQRQEKAAETTEFLQTESGRLADTIGDLEGKLAEFKQRNAGQLPEQFEINLRLIDRTENELLEAGRRLQALEEQRIYLTAELAGTNPFGSYVVDGNIVMSPGDQLKALRTQFISLSGSYGPAHPDVLKLRREIEALERETNAGPDADGLAKELEVKLADLAVVSEKYGPEHPDVVRVQRQVDGLRVALADARQNPNGAVQTAANPDNPAYIQLQARLQSVESEMQALRSQQASLKDSLAMYEARVLQTPEVEREYLLLQRDYENARAKYQDVKAKQLEAELAESLEIERKGERFSLIEPPQLPLEPAKPNRLAIILLGFIFSIASGIGLVMLLDLLDQSIHGPRQLAAVVGVSPLVVIPYIENSVDRRRVVRTRIIAAGGAVLMVCCVLLLAHVYIAPLDVLWFDVTRRLGF